MRSRFGRTSLRVGLLLLGAACGDGGSPAARTIAAGNETPAPEAGGLSDEPGGKPTGASGGSADREGNGDLPIVGVVAMPPGAAAEGEPPAAPSPRRELSFNTDWKYRQGEVAGADALAYDDSAWTYVDLPHSTKFVTPDDVTAYLVTLK